LGAGAHFRPKSARGATAEGEKTLSRSTTRYTIRLFVLFVSMVFVGADLSVSAQNANSSTTMQEDTSMQNSNTSNTNMNRGGRRRRRGRRRSGSNMGMSNSNSACGPMQDNMSMGGSGQQNANMNTTPAPTGRCDPNAQEQTDLSGTYTGTANYTEGGLSGETTLTINGNDFTMTSGSTTQEGRIVAVTTCNYTGVTMMFGKTQVTATSGAQPAPVPIVSLRARKVAGGLMLESVGGETRQFSFSSAPASGGGGARKRSSRGRRMGTPIPVGIKPPTR
jgi:hypothetical protein